MRGLSMLVLGLAITLAGCSVRTPGVSVDIGGGGGGHGGDFCPPGQAKKGNC